VSGIVHELTLLQEREGWLSELALKELAVRLGVPLHRLESVSTFYTHFRHTPPRGIRVAICRDVACALAAARPEAASGGAQREALALRDDLELCEVSCLGRCDGAPVAEIGTRIVDLSDPAAVDAALADPGAATSRPVRTWEAADPYAESGAPPYSALPERLARDPAELVQMLETSGLRGMGGAGFPTGRKWSLVASEPATPRYVVCNADESEPGTFKDREILHDLPHLVIEGMVLAAHAVGAARGFLFLRHEYEPERRRFVTALAQARALGALGPDALGPNQPFDIEIFISPGGYILGEETALLECMEDRRGEPRNKPPFPGSHGLWGKPTLMNNVETFVHAAAIAQRGVEWWRSLGRSGFAGHKFMAVSGDVARPDVVLVPFGTTLGELLERCGGMRDGRRLLAVAPGGASSNFLPADRLDTPLDFQTLQDAGSMLGSGAAIFVAEGRDLLEVGLNVARFFRNESCGKCVPCRVGSEKAVRWVEEAGAVSEEIETGLRRLHHTLERTSICGLGQVALGPLLSILEHFPAATRR